MTKEEFYKKKKEEYDAIIKSNPNNAKNYHYRARAKVELADLLRDEDLDKAIELGKKAIKDLDKAIELEPREYHQMWNYHLRARANAGLKKYESAIEDLDKALTLHPNKYGQMLNYRLRAQAYHERKKHDKAAADIKKAENIDPIDYENYKLKEMIDGKQAVD